MCIYTDTKKEEEVVWVLKTYDIVKGGGSFKNTKKLISLYAYNLFFVYVVKKTHVGKQVPPRADP